jgi:peptidoglycan hydrolase CwlO-like protein
MIDLSSIATWATIIGPMIGGAYTVFRMIKKSSTDRKKKYSDLERKISILQEDLEALREDVDKDLAHLKESYKTEISFLSQKITDLRSEISSQNDKIMNLLTSLIGRD